MEDPNKLTPRQIAERRSKGYDEILNYPVRRSNTLLRDFCFRLTLPEYKIFMIAVACISTKDSYFKTEILSFKDLRKLLGRNYTNDELEDIIDSINTKQLEVEPPYIPGYIGVKRKLKLFNSIDYYIKEENGQKCVSLELHGSLKPHLLELRKNYCTGLVRQSLELSSPERISFYGFISSHSHAGSVCIAVDEFKELIGLTFKDYRGLRRGFLDPVQKKLRSSKFTIKFLYEGIRDGVSSRISHLQFYIMNSDKDPDWETRTLKNIGAYYEEKYKKGMSEYYKQKQKEKV